MRTWQSDPARNLLAPSNLDRIGRALREGPIFGYWYRAHSGSGPNQWLAQDFDQLMSVTAGARPGDLYVVWSLPALLRQRRALAAGRYADLPVDSSSLLSAAGIRAIKQYLADPRHEIIAVFFGTERGPEIWVNDQASLEYAAECAEWYNRPGGEAYVFPFTDIDNAASWLLQAQYPNHRGEVLVDQAE